VFFRSQLTSASKQVVRLVKSCDEGVGLGAGRLQVDAVDGEECVSRCKCRPFVAVDEGVTLRKAFPERRRLFDDIRIVLCLRSEQGRFEEAGVA
jgi:hypothetical protein